MQKMELWLVAFLVKFFFNKAQLIARLDSAYKIVSDMTAMTLDSDISFTRTNR
jgi:hypothetical protein